VSTADGQPQRCYDLYGSRTLSMDQMRASVDGALGIEFSSRDSYHMGGSYFRASHVRETEYVIQLNRDEDPEPLESAFPSTRCCSA